MRVIVSIFVILFIIGLYYYYKLYNELDNMGMDIEVGSIDFSKFNLSNFSTGGSDIKTNISVYADNTNGDVTLTFNSLVFSLYYNGYLIAKTSNKASNSIAMTIPANSKAVVSQEFDVYINAGSVALISDINLNKNVQIQYVANLKWYLISIPTISGTFGTE